MSRTWPSSLATVWQPTRGGVDGRVLGREAAVEAPGDEPPSSEKSSIGAVDVAVDEPTGGDVAKPSGTASVESSTKKASPE